MSSLLASQLTRAAVVETSSLLVVPLSLQCASWAAAEQPRTVNVASDAGRKQRTIACFPRSHLKIKCVLK